MVETTDLPDSAPAPPHRAVAGWEHFRRHLARHWVHWALGAAFVGHLVVVWGTTWLPMQDVPAHIQLMDAMTRADDPATSYPETFTTGSPLTANGMSLMLAMLFGGSIGLVAVAKLLVTWFVIGFPLSVLTVARAFGRPDWLAILSTPFVFGALFNIGFLNYIVSLPLLLFAVAMSRRFAVDGGVRRGLALWVVLVLTYFAHIMGFVIAVGIVTFVLALFLPSLARWRRLLPVVASLPLAVAWVFDRIVAGDATESGRTMLGPDGLGAVYAPLDERIWMTHEWGMSFSKGSSDEFAFLVIVGVWLLAMTASGRGADTLDPAPTPDGGTILGRARAWLQGYALEAITACCVLAFFLLPNHFTEVHVIAQRTWLISIAFLLLWPRVRPTTWRFAMLVAPALVVSLAYPWAVHGTCKTFQQRYVGDLPTAIADLPDTSRLMIIVNNRETSLTHMGTLWHLPRALHAIYNGGTTNSSFAIRPYYPVRYRPNRTPVRYLEPAFWADGNLGNYDHVLLLSSRKPPKGATTSSAVRLVWNQGPWWLFEVSNPHHTPMIGGPGGSSVVRTCTAGKVLTGLTVWAERHKVLDVRVICGQRRVTDPEEGRPVQCQRGQKVTALTGTADTYVHALGIECTGDRQPDPIGDELGRPFQLECKKGERAMGVRLRQGLVVDAIGLECEPPSPPPVKVVHPPE